MVMIAVYSDIHGNIAALNKVIEYVSKKGVDRHFVCGDIVGYGKHPNECCDRLQEMGACVVAGNHDWATIGRTTYRDTFSRSAIEGIELTRWVLTDANKRWLSSLPLIHSEDQMEFVHATMHEPETWPYLTVGSISGESMFQDIHKCFDAQNGRVCFVGHSHRPAVFAKDYLGTITVMAPEGEKWVHLTDHKAVVDVGSVGLPRGRHVASSAVLYDTKASKFKMISITS